MIYNCHLYDIILDIRRMAFLTPFKIQCIKELQLSISLKQLLSEYYMDQHLHSYGHNEDTII
jgi:hypothetical protein